MKSRTRSRIRKSPFCTTSNAWKDENLVAHVNAVSKNRLVIAGRRTSVCCSGPVISVLMQGFEVYVVTGVCGDCSPEAHELANQYLTLLSRMSRLRV